MKEQLRSIIAIELILLNCLTYSVGAYALADYLKSRPVTQPVAGEFTPLPFPIPSTPAPMSMRTEIPVPPQQEFFHIGQLDFQGENGKTAPPMFFFFRNIAAHVFPKAYNEKTDDWSKMFSVSMKDKNISYPNYTGYDKYGRPVGFIIQSGHTNTWLNPFPLPHWEPLPWQGFLKEIEGEEARNDAKKLESKLKSYRGEQVTIVQGNLKPNTPIATIKPDGLGLVSPVFQKAKIIDVVRFGPQQKQKINKDYADAFKDPAKDPVNILDYVSSETARQIINGKTVAIWVCGEALMAGEKSDPNYPTYQQSWYVIFINVT